MSQGSPPTNVPQDELQRLVAAELARQQHQQPPAPNGYTVRDTAAVASNVINLDEQLDQVDLSPQQILLGGHIYQVRRDFTPREARAVLAMASSADENPENEVKFWAALVGDDDATRLRDYTDDLENLKVQRIVAQLLVSAGLGTLGEG